MKHIVTVTFNPAVDKSTTVPQLVPSHKMKTTAPVYQPGGGGVNVARALKMLGTPATAIYFEGGNAGLFFSALLEEEGVNTIPIKTQGATRENFIVSEVSTGKQYRFGLPAPAISEAELAQLLGAIAAIEHLDYLVISGSIPENIPLSIFERLKSIADLKKARLVVDTSGLALAEALTAGLYLIKPSLSEIAELSGKHNISKEEAIEAAKQLINSNKCEIIVISLGGDGAVLVSKDAVFDVAAPQVKVMSTVGAGDSMLAGILYTLAHNRDLSTALKYGVACGTAATIKLGTGLCEKARVEELFGGMS